MHYNFLIPIHDGKMEEPAIFMRQHPLILSGLILRSLLLLVLPLAIAVLLPTELSSWLERPTLGPIVILLAALYELLMLLLAYSAFMDWYLDVWVVTNERIVDINQNGVFSREIAELQLSKVQDVSAEQKGVWATLFGYGTIRVQSAGEQGTFEFRGLAEPYEVARRILELVQADQHWHQQALAEQINTLR